MPHLCTAWASRATDHLSIRMARRSPDLEAGPARVRGCSLQLRLTREQGRVPWFARAEEGRNPYPPPVSFKPGSSFRTLGDVNREIAQPRLTRQEGLTVRQRRTSLELRVLVPMRQGPAGSAGLYASRAQNAHFFQISGAMYRAS